MRVIDFSHPEWRALAQQLLDEAPQVIRGRQWQPLIGMLRDNQLLLPLGNHRYELTPTGRRYLTRELMLAELACAPPEPEEWLHAQGWQLGERVNERVLAALYRKGRRASVRSSRSTLKTRGYGCAAICRCACGPPRPFSLFFSGGTLLDAAPWLHTLGEVALPARTLAGLGKILWGEGEIQRVISTDSVGVFAELSLPDDALLVWLPAQDPGALQPLIAALPPQTLWSHLTALDPAGVDRVLVLAQRLGRQASWWLPRDLAPIKEAYAAPLQDARPWEPSRIPRPLRALCSDLVESNRGLSAEVCALASGWHAIG